MNSADIKADFDPALRAQAHLTAEEEALIEIPSGFPTILPTARLDSFFTVRDDGSYHLNYVELNGESPASMAYSDVLSDLFLETPLMKAFGERYHVDSLAVGRRSAIDALLRIYYQWRGNRDKLPDIAIVDWEGVPTTTEFQADDITEAYVRANACDPVSAFGGIVAVNRPVTVAMAEALAPVFTEVVVAPGYDEGALDVFARKGNLRVLTARQPFGSPFDMRSIDGGLLVQQADTVSPDRSGWQVVTEAQPTPEQWADLAFAWHVCAVVSSNAIVFAKDGQAFGVGAGQQNRVDSARIAATRADGRADGGVCASDAFFPFRDTLDVAAAAGIRAIIQPGGSVRDEESIAAANEHGIAMVFTGERHFRH